ncbi:MAG: glycyl-tRNA synthetase [Abditibacteriota bacterium]|nr:glycyl-tRNA synthetase [Abditibacteriota bacterium]
MALKMEEIVSLCKRRGFVFQSSEIYGGFASCWDYGPLGAELKRNVKNAWWRAVVQERDDMVGLDSSILMHPKIWEASGHIATFNDPLVDCKTCKSRFRADHLDTTPCPQKSSKMAGQAEPCALTEARLFNLMFKTHVGPVDRDDDSNVAYLRPETAQGIFVNFPNVLTTSRKKLPFGIAQIGKAFRNEITPGNFTFRTREFEQMEIEYFCRPEDAPRLHEEWIQARYQWYLDLGMKRENLSLRPHEKDELAHYAQSAESTGTTDIEYQFPFMDKPAELEGIANRADFDLSQHAKFSGQKLTYFDQANNEHITPYVIEPSAGADRATLAFLVDAYHEEEVKEGDTRVVLKFHPQLAPVKVAILPLAKNKAPIVEVAQRLRGDLAKKMVAQYDDTAGIGKLYRRQDEIGTPYCVTVDFDTVEKDNAVTVRDRDTMQQERIALDQVKNYLLDKLDV